MKKILSFLLAFVLILSFAGCGKEEKNKNENGIDIEYYANLGQMPELKYSLGEEVEKVKSELSKAAESDESAETVYSLQEGENNVLIDNGEICYYYKKADPEKGIGYIVNYGTAYGFEIGTVTVEIKEALADYSFKEEALTDENAFFMFGTESGSVIECEFKGNTVLFVFEDSSLCATALYVTEDW